MTALRSIRRLARRPFRPARAVAALSMALAILTVLATPARSASGVHFTDATAAFPEIAAFRRVPSATLDNARAVQALGTVLLDDFIGPFPIKPHGAPGVALLDYDGDGDLDLYATNGPGGANALFSNLLVETGSLDFVDVAVAAGVDATDQDSSGVCYGDIDNDGDPDLYVLGRSEPDRLFENLGDGTFADITAASGTGGGDLASTTCSMADFDGDGLLDIVVAHSFDMSTNLPIFVVPFALSQPNQLFLSAGNDTFVDASASSGVGAVQEITWSVAAVDLNQDGIVDILTANDNGTIPFAASGGVDRGLLRYLVNDGTGHFTDVTHAVGLDTPGDWMGLAFADFDSNGTIDLFASNSGDWIEDFLGVPGAGLGVYASRWHLQRLDGTFADPGVGAMVAGGFSWGTSALDYDNDGDSDLVFYGGIDAGPFVDASNPGSLAENDGAAGFTYDLGALIPSGAPHHLRIENGLAVGDLDADGFPDIVSISGANLPTQPFGPIPYPRAWGSPIDGLAVLFPTWFPGTEPNQFVYSGVHLPLGTVAVELQLGRRGRPPRQPRDRGHHPGLGRRRRRCAGSPRRLRRGRPGDAGGRVDRHPAGARRLELRLPERPRAHLRARPGAPGDGRGALARRGPQPALRGAPRRADRLAGDPVQLRRSGRDAGPLPVLRRPGARRPRRRGRRRPAPAGPVPGQRPPGVRRDPSRAMRPDR